MPEIQDLFIYAAGAFIVWALQRLVQQLDQLERRQRKIELEMAGIRGRLHLQRGDDLEDPA